jgi:hypothetical protein
MSFSTIYNGWGSREDFEREQLKRWGVNPATQERIERAEREISERGYTNRNYKNDWKEE